MHSESAPKTEFLDTPAASFISGVILFGSFVILSLIILVDILFFLVSTVGGCIVLRGGH